MLTAFYRLQLVCVPPVALLLSWPRSICFRLEHLPPSKVYCESLRARYSHAAAVVSKLSGGVMR